LHVLPVSAPDLRARIQGQKLRGIAVCISICDRMIML
jgi:hypothetical protein